MQFEKERRYLPFWLSSIIAIIGFSIIIVMIFSSQKAISFFDLYTNNITLSDNLLLNVTETDEIFHNIINKHNTSLINKYWQKYNKTLQNAYLLKKSSRLTKYNVSIDSIVIELKNLKSTVNKKFLSLKTSNFKSPLGQVYNKKMIRLNFNLSNLQKRITADAERNYQIFKTINWIIIITLIIFIILFAFIINKHFRKAFDYNDKISKNNKDLEILIKELNDTKNKLMEERELFNLATRSGKVGVWIIDLKKEIIQIDNNLSAILGLDDNKQVYKLEDWLNFIHPDNREHVHKTIEDHLNGKSKELVIEYKMIRGDGKIIWILSRGQAIKNKKDEPLKILGINIDITQQKQYEQKIKESEKKFRNLLDYTYNWESWLNPEGDFEYISPSVEAITGYKPEEFQKDKNLFLKIIHPDNKEELKEHMKNLNSPVTGKLEFKIIKKNGDIRVIRHNCQPVFDEKGEFIGRRASNRNATDRWLAEQKLKEEIANKDKFFSIISHDLRSPFTALLGYSQMLDEEFDSLTQEEIKNSISSLRKTSKNVFQLLEGLLEWSRAQSDRIEFKQELVDLFEASKNVEILLKNVAAQKGINYLNQILKNTIVFADENMVNTILRNLVSNAIKFTNPGGIVNISSSEGQDKITVIVSDTGKGMTKNELDQLFKINVHFTTIGTNNEVGAGVGLILCKELIEKNGGEIWAESEPGKGSKFYFTLNKPLNKNT